MQLLKLPSMRIHTNPKNWPKAWRIPPFKSINILAGTCLYTVPLSKMPILDCAFKIPNDEDAIAGRLLPGGPSNSTLGILRDHRGLLPLRAAPLPPRHPQLARQPGQHSLTGSSTMYQLGNFKILNLFFIMNKEISELS